MESKAKDINNCPGCPFFRSVQGTFLHSCLEQPFLDWSRHKSDYGAASISMKPDYKHPECKIKGITIHYKTD